MQPMVVMAANFADAINVAFDSAEKGFAAVVRYNWMVEHWTVTIR